MRIGTLPGADGSCRRLYRRAIIAALLGFQLLGVTSANADSVENGRRLAHSHCSRCHSINKVGPSPLSIASPFRTLYERYPVETLQ
jgi:cytochrome c